MEEINNKILSIVLCDDNEKNMDELNKYIREFSASRDLEISTKNYQNGDDLLRDKSCYDVALLDIEMPDKSGLDVGIEMRKFDTEIKIVFVTNHPEYHKNAFGIHAFDYLVKPVSSEQIYKLLDEVIRYLPEKKKEKSKIKFLLKEGMMNFAVNDILYFEYFDRKVILHATDNKTYTFQREKISAVAKKMQGYNFEVSHKSFVVNLYYVNSVKGYEVFLTNGKSLPLSQCFSKGFRKKLNHYFRDQVR